MESGGGAIVTGDDDGNAARAMEALRSVRYPGFGRDIVAAGFVKDITVEGDRVTVRFAPNTRNDEKIARMEADIRSALTGAGRFEHVEIQRRQPFPDGDVLSSGAMTPLQAEMLEDGVAPAPDEMTGAMRRPDMAPRAGYREDGPEMVGPRGPRNRVYDGALPVFQWQIDPQDAAAESGTVNLTIDDWEFRVWWQVHPARLVYASIQAMREDAVKSGGAARSHPVGRSAAVNLVYDPDRKAVVAIYGTVQDFRPFVDAFHRGYILNA